MARLARMIAHADASINEPLHSFDFCIVLYLWTSCMLVEDACLLRVTSIKPNLLLNLGIVE